MRALRPDRAATPAGLHRPWVAVVRQRMKVPARRASEHVDEEPFVEPRNLADGPETPAVELRRRHSPDSPEPFDGQRMQEAELVVRRHDEQPVRLRDGARHLREELRSRDSHGDRQPYLARGPAAADAPRSRSERRPVARARGRRGTPRRSRALRRAASCPRTRRTRPCSPPSTPTSAAGRRRRAGTAAAPGARPWPSGCRTPSPRSSRRARPRRRR